MQKNMKPKIFTLLIVFIASSELFAFTIDNLSYSILGGDSVKVSQSYMTTDATMGDIVIPATVSYGEQTYRVVETGSFFACQKITSVTLPNSIITIGEGSFNGCTNMTTINIPNNVRTIKSDAFRDCWSLQTITISNNVTSIGDYAFTNCTNLVSITIGDSVKNIGQKAFTGCTKIDSVVWNAKNCENYASGFYPSVTKFIIGEGVEIIPLGLCGGLSGLDTIVIPNSVEYIGNYAFRSCTGLSSITIGTNVDSIGENVFQNCTSLASVEWNARHCADFNDNASSKPFSALANTITSFTFGNEVEYVPAYLCKGLNKIDTIYFPNSINSIGSNAFRGCTSIKHLNLPNNIEDIGSYAFSGCNGLQSVTLPNNITEIDNGVFSSCRNLETLILPEGITNIGVWAFYYCDNLKSIIFPESLRSVGKEAFANCRLYSFDMGNGLQTIDDYAFYRCSFDSVVVGNSVTNIGRRAFSECRFLQKAFLPSSIEHIGSDAFTGNQLLESIYVPCGEIERFKEMLQKDSTKVKYEYSPYKLETYFKLVEDPNQRITAFPSPIEVPQNISVCDSLISIYVSDYEDTKHYHFKQWEDGNTDNPRYIALTQDTTLIAIMEADTYLLSVAYDEKQGIVIGEGIEYFRVGIGMGVYPLGEAVTINAIPNEGYVFERWSDNNTDNPRTLIIESDVTLTAYFIPDAGTSVEYNHTGGIIPYKKIIDGKILILRGDKTYTLQGQEVK